MSGSDGAVPGPGAPGTWHAHPAIEEQLAAYTAGELDPAERQRIQAHLASCAPCAAALADVQRIRSLLRTLASPTADAGAGVPASVADGVLARLAEPLPDDSTVASDLWLARDGDEMPLAGDARPLSRQDGVVSAAQRPASPADSRRGWDRAGRWQLDGAGAGESAPMERRNPHVADEPPTISMTTLRLSRRKPPTVPTMPFARARGLPAVAATLAIVVLSAALFGMLSSRNLTGVGAGPTATTQWATPTPTPPSTPAINSGEQLQPLPGLPGGGFVSSISMDGPNDGWAAGWSGAGGQSGYTGQLLHYTGGRWVLSPDTFPGVFLADVSMDSPDDGWAVGTRAGPSTGVVLHYTGGHWTEVNTPISQFTGAKVRAASPTLAWVVGNVPSSPSSTQQGMSQSTIWLANRSSGPASVLLLYNQGTWSQFDSPLGITDIFQLSPDDIWATTDNGLALHFLAGHWTTFFIGAEAQGEQLQSLHMTSDNEGWAAGFSNTSPRGMFLAHFDGSQWTRVQGPAASGATNLPAIDMVSATEGWAGGDLSNGQSGQQTVLLHYLGGRWQQVPLNYSGSIESIDMVSASEGWAVVAGSTSGLLHYHNGRWTPYDPGQ